MKWNKCNIRTSKEFKDLLSYIKAIHLLKTGRELKNPLITKKISTMLLKNKSKEDLYNEFIRF